MQRHILVVEDEVLVGIMLAKQLRDQGYTVADVVTSGEDAIARAAEISQGVVRMDVRLSGKIDGVEAAVRLRSEFGMPIIFFTGYSQDPVLVERAKAANPVAIISKLGRFEDILAALETAFAQIGSDSV